MATSRSRTQSAGQRETGAGLQRGEGTGSDDAGAAFIAAFLKAELCIQSELYV